MEAPDITKKHQSDAYTLKRIQNHHPTSQAELIVNDAGIIADCNTSSEALFEYNKNYLIGRNVSMIIPELSDIDIAKRGAINSRLRMLSRIRWRFKVKTCSSRWKQCHLFFSDFPLHQEHHIRLIVSEFP